jgi:predicted metal-binding protein
MNTELLEQQLAELPLYAYFFTTPEKLEFSDRIRWICENECPRYNKSWACPPAVGSVESCRAKCLQYQNCLVIGTITEVADIADIKSALDTRFDHEALTEEVAALMGQQGVAPYILSTDSCCFCETCAWCEGKPCRFPEKMHPCVESHGINVIPVLEENGLEFQYGDNIITLYSLLFF